jgi:hypothetical protein
MRAVRGRALLVLCVAGPPLVGLLLALWQLGAKPFWYDETFEGLLVQRAPLSFARWIATFETSGALYHAFLWLWKFLAATGGYWVRYAQEARPYALYLLLSALATLALLRAVEAPTARRWVVYGVTSVLAVWTHLFMVFVVLAHAVALAVHPARERWTRRASLAVAAALLAGVPIVVSLYFNLHRFGWMAGATPVRIGRLLEELSGDLGTPVLLAWLAAWTAGAAVGLTSWRASRTAGWPALLILSVAIVPIALPTVLSLIRPMLVTRYAIAVLPALAILAVLGVAQLRLRPVVGAAAAVLLATNAVAVVAWYADRDRPDWRSATAYVLEQTQPGTRIVYFTRGPLDGGARYEYSYYVTQHPGSSPPPVLGLPPGEGSVADRTAAAISQTGRLLAVAYSWDDAAAAEALAAIEAQFALAEQVDYEQISVRVYERRDTLR